MKRLIVSAFVLAVLPLGIFAAEFAHSLLVTLASGTTVEYRFENTPVIQFVGDDIEITANDSETLRQPVADVVNFTFSAREVVGIGEVRATGEHIVVSYDGAVLSVTGLHPGSVMGIYSTNGTLCAKVTADGDGAASLSVQQLPDGIYVAASAEHQFKFIKK